MSSRWPMRLGRPLKNQTCEQGLASSIWPSRSRRTRDSVTSTPHLSQITPRCFMRLYLPHKHSQSWRGAEDAGAEQPVALRLEGAVVDGLRLGDFAVGPAADLFGRRKRNANRIEIRNQIGSIVRRGSQNASMLKTWGPGVRGRGRGSAPNRGACRLARHKSRGFRAPAARRDRNPGPWPPAPGPHLTSPRPAPCPESPAASSSTRHPGRATATRG